MLYDFFLLLELTVNRYTNTQMFMDNKKLPSIEWVKEHIGGDDTTRAVLTKLAAGGAL